MIDKLYENVEELVVDLKEEFGEDSVCDEDVELWNRLKGESGVVLNIDSDLGYESSVFVVNEEGEMFGFEGNNDSLKEFKLEERNIVELLCFVLDNK